MCQNLIYFKTQSHQVSQLSLISRRRRALMDPLKLLWWDVQKLLGIIGVSRLFAAIEMMPIDSSLSGSVNFQATLIYTLEATREWRSLASWTAQSGHYLSHRVDQPLQFVRLVDHCNQGLATACGPAEYSRWGRISIKFLCQSIDKLTVFGNSIVNFVCLTALVWYFHLTHCQITYGCRCVPLDRWTFETSWSWWRRLL